jgi:hypothetical protein
MPITRGTPANGGKPTTAVAPETVGKPANRCCKSYIRNDSKQCSDDRISRNATDLSPEGTTEMVRTQTTVGTPVTPGIQAELGSLDRRRTARAECLKHMNVSRKFTKVVTKRKINEKT